MSITLHRITTIHSKGGAFSRATLTLGIAPALLCSLGAFVAAITVSSSAAASTPVSLGTGSIAGQIVNGNGGCLDLPNGDASNGALLHIWQCDGDGVNQTWFVDGSGSIHYGPNPLKCVDFPGQSLDSNGDPINMTQLQLWDCNNATGPDQVWSVGANNQIQFARNAAKCVELRNGSSANDTAVQVFDCNGTSGQTWSLLQGGPVQPVQLQNGNGACLDLPDGNAVNGAQLQLWQCDSNGRDQSWYVDGMNAIHSSVDPSKCADFPAQGWSSGGFVDTQMQLWDCNGGSGPDQNIPLLSNHTLQISGSPCVEARGGSFANGTAVQGSSCNGTTGQTWYPRLVGQTRQRLAATDHITNGAIFASVDLRALSTGQFSITPTIENHDQLTGYDYALSCNVGKFAVGYEGHVGPASVFQFDGPTRDAPGLFGIQDPDIAQNWATVTADWHASPNSSPSFGCTMSAASTLGQSIDQLLATIEGVELTNLGLDQGSLEQLAVCVATSTNQFMCQAGSPAHLCVWPDNAGSTSSLCDYPDP